MAMTVHMANRIREETPQKREFADIKEK